MTTLEDWIFRLEAIEDIRQLKARSCAYGDRLIPLDDGHTIFTADAVWDGGKVGRHEGRDAIVACFHQQVPVMLFFRSSARQPDHRGAGRHRAGA